MTQPIAGTPLAEAVNAALATVIDPELRRPITELGMVDSVQVSDDGKVTVAVLLHRNAVPVILPVLRQQQQGRRVGSLQREHQGQQGEAKVPRVELPLSGRPRVPAQPEDAEHGHVDQELRGAHEPGKAFCGVPERVRIRGELGQDPLAGAQGRVEAAF